MALIPTRNILGTRTSACQSGMKTGRTRLDDCFGIPVIFDSELKVVSQSRGIWPWKRIFLGPSFAEFPSREQAAILLHAVGHCKMRHLEKRIAGSWRVLFGGSALVRLCVAQEYEADAFAANCGYAVELAKAFSRMELAGSHGGGLHPGTRNRIERLCRMPQDMGGVGR